MQDSGTLNKPLRIENKIAYLKWKMGKIGDQNSNHHSTQNRSFCQKKTTSIEKAFLVNSTNGYKEYGNRMKIINVSKTTFLIELCSIK